MVISGIADHISLGNRTHNNYTLRHFMKVPEENVVRLTKRIKSCYNRFWT